MVLEKLESYNVVSFRKLSKSFVAEEFCDHYYNLVMTKEDLVKLAQELLDLAET